MQVKQQHKRIPYWWNEAIGNQKMKRVQARRKHTRANKNHYRELKRGKQRTKFRKFIEASKHSKWVLNCKMIFWETDIRQP